MVIRITSIKTCEGEHENPYVAIDYLEWIDERKKITGATERAKIYDWIKNAQGIAYIIDANGNKAFLKPAISASGNKYVKTVTNGAITDGLLLLPQCG